MIAAILIGVAALLVALEVFSLRAIENVGLTFEADHSLTAPGEEIVMRYTVSNASFLPIMYTALSVYFDGKVVVRESEQWKKDNVFQDFSGVYVDRKLFLPPHRRVSGRIRFSYENRGVHEIGRIYLETGDYLGLRSVVRSPKGGNKIVCTAPLSDQDLELTPFGGLLGEVSVLRFLHEDPCLVAGYREYTGREPMKQISWTQTAKTGELMVKLQDHTADADVAVLVELGAGSSDTCERCLALTRSVCEFLEERKIPYELISNGDLGFSAKGLGKGHLYPILRAIGLSSNTGYTGFADAVERCILEKRPDRTFIVISPDLEEKLLQRLQAKSEHRVFVLGREEAES